MRVSREAAAASKARITREAARLMREQGIDATSVADVMSAAGMTTGGFYKHFKSKDDLSAAAVREAFGSILGGFSKPADAAATSAARQFYLKHYLSEAHVNNPGKGCPVAAMGADGGRASHAVSSEFHQGVEMMLQALGSENLAREDRAAVFQLMSTLVGAVVLARAVGEGDLRTEILAAARGFLKPQKT